MTQKEKYGLIRESFKRHDCERCAQAIKDRVHPDHDMRCPECNESLKQRWQQQQREVSRALAASTSA